MKPEIAVNLWDTWAESRNKTKGGSVIPPCKEVWTITPKELNDIVPMFVMEMKFKNGPASKGSITNILSTIQNYLDKQKGNCNSLFGKQHHKFLTGKVRQTIRKRVAISHHITTQIEHELWQDAIIDSRSNQGLSRAVYFYNIKIFGITSVKDHQNLKPQCFEFSENAYGQYVTLNCKMLLSYSSYKKLKSQKNKSMKNEGDLLCKVIHYEDPGNSRSYYKILKNYLHAIAQLNKTNFYFRPCANKTEGFTDEALGKNKMESCVQDMMRCAGYENSYSNQSLRSLMDFSGRGAEQVHTGYEYIVLARRSTTVSHSTLKEISKKLDPPQPSVFTPVLLSEDPTIPMASVPQPPKPSVFTPVPPSDDPTIPMASVPQPPKPSVFTPVPPSGDPTIPMASVPQPPQPSVFTPVLPSEDPTIPMASVPQPPQPSVFTPVPPSEDPTILVASVSHLYNTQEDRAAPPQYNYRSAPPPSLYPPPEKKQRLEDYPFREVLAPSTAVNNQWGSLCVKTDIEELDCNNVGTSSQCHLVGTSSQYHLVGTSPQCQLVGTSSQYHLVGTSPQCQLRTAVDVRHGSFNINLTELLPPGAKDIHIEGTKNNTEEQMLLQIDFKVARS